MKRSEEFDNFDRIEREILKVPLREIEAKLDEEKAGEKRKKPRKPEPGRSGTEEVFPVLSANGSGGRPPAGEKNENLFLA
jgi:hypothetical protein